MKKSYILLICLILLSGIVSASITISPPARVYSLGDTIQITMTINPSKVEGNFELKLVCGENFETFYKISPAISAFTANQETKINHKIILEREYIGNLTGEYHLSANLGSITAQTEKFRISSDITVTATLDKEFYDPGESIVLDIDAVKANGQRLTGFVKGIGIFNFEKKIIDGRVREILATSDSLEAGRYELELFIYDENKNGEILNSKNTSLNFYINQIPYSVPLSLASLEATPGKIFEFGVDIFDQSGEKIEGLANIEFISPNKERIQLTLESGKTGEIEFPTNATAGKWTIYSSHGRLMEERTITLLAVPKLDINFIESSSVLVIKNIGNADYIGDVSVDIGEETINKTLNIKPGEERKFTLSAPTGEHDVKVSAGDDTIEMNLLLTGQVVSMKDYGKFLLFSEYPAVWSIIATIIILLAIVLFFRYNKKNFSLNKKIKAKLNNLRNMKSDSTGKKMLETEEKSKINTAEASLVIKGMREPSTIITLKIKNEIKPFIKENLEKVLLELTEKNNAVIDFKEKGVFIIFSPRKTRTYKNEYSAIKMALELNTILQENNRKFNEKIEFGIGINSGDLISTIEQQKLKYTGVDNTIIASKKIAEMSNQEVIISEKVKNKLLREVRTEKIEKSGNTYYKVLKISERQDNQAKLKDLLKRTHLD
jgi:5-hydroxyisourate hydrolase-like protein (transthyretin family)